MTRLKRWAVRFGPVVRVAYANRKTEIALATGVAAVVREIVQAATGH